VLRTGNTSSVRLCLTPSPQGEGSGYARCFGEIIGVMVVGSLYPSAEVMPIYASRLSRTQPGPLSCVTEGNKKKGLAKEVSAARQLRRLRWCLLWCRCSCILLGLRWGLVILGFFFSKDILGDAPRIPSEPPRRAFKGEGSLTFTSPLKIPLCGGVLFWDRVIRRIICVGAMVGRLVGVVLTPT